MRRRYQEDRWLPLATYNAEVSRGIVHTPEWKAKMADWQKLFDAEMAERYGGKPRFVPSKPDPTC
jgi:hypothetical protein